LGVHDDRPRTDLGFGRVKRRLHFTVSDWRIHDIRRTVASGMARIGVDPHVIEKVLNHKSGIISGVAAVYNRYGYEKEKRVALIKWAEHVVGISADDGRRTPTAHELIR
jgi:integrase